MIDDRFVITHEINSYIEKKFLDEEQTNMKYYLYMNASKYEIIEQSVGKDKMIYLKLKNELGDMSQIKISLNKFKELFIKNSLF